ncbi:MAG: hypothetical protein D6808_07310 [Candidatus Dadabacteria bacterium]|nr:MAG: hypothetical protein D6808_07310 [Candidatus Dadabacteria bacterium]
MPQKKPFNVPFSLIILSLAAATALVALNLKFINYAYDDAYIHFRIAENFLKYGVPYYNVDEPVMGSSSPLWILVLAGLFSVFGVSIKAVAVLNGLIVSGAATAWALILREETEKEVFCLVGFVSTLIVLYISGAGLMETPLAVLLLGVGVILFLRESPKLSVVFLTLAAFTRMELFIFLLTASAYYALKRKSLKWALPLAITAAPFLLFNWHYFGSEIPQPILAKPNVYGLSALESLATMIDSVLSPLFPLIPVKVGRVLFFVPLFASLSAFLIMNLGKTYSPRKKTATSFSYLITLPTTLLIVCYIFSKTIIFQWYIPLFYVPAITWALSAAVHFNTISIKALCIALLFPYIFSFSKDTISFFGNPSMFSLFFPEARVRQLRKIARDLYAKYPNARVLAPEIGGVGFEFKGRIIDAIGLITPEALRYRQREISDPKETSNTKTDRTKLIGSVSREMILAFKPDIVLGLETMLSSMEAPPLSDLYEKQIYPIFAQEDASIATTKSIFMARRINVYIRRDFVLKQKEIS